METKLNSSCERCSYSLVELNERGKRVVGYSVRVTMVDATAGADSDAGCVSDYHR